MLKNKEGINMDKKQSRRNFLKASSLFALVGANAPKYGFYSYAQSKQFEFYSKLSC